MKFKDYQYQRIDLEKIKEQITTFVTDFNNGDSPKKQLEIIKDFNILRNHISTMGTLVSIRHSINTKDHFYETERQFLNESGPIVGSFVHQFYQAISKSKFRKELEKSLGRHLFDIIDCELKTFDDKIIEELQQENQLITKYQKMIASAKISFNDEEKNLSEMAPYLQNSDRKIRKQACSKVADFFGQNTTQFDEIFDQLVKIRTQKAKKLGFKNYIELGYLNLGRTDYVAADVKKYRQQIQEKVVPIVSKLKQRQAQRIGLDGLKIYDEAFKFKTGNPKPQGDADWIIKNAQTMYRELSPETNQFFGFMQDKDLMDLLAKKGKSAGGYCTFIPDFKSPFIFANFNGTASDIEVLTHEAGHAFQIFQSRDFSVPEYLFPTLEACEIHSMTMEFLTWPWMNLFFKKDAEKFKFQHLVSSISFLPYGAAVDEFQHWIYENHQATPLERRQQWTKIEKKYMPSLDYDDIDNLKNGGWWFRQGHIFSSPFYYIDYALAQVCAFQFWLKYQTNPGRTWQDYLRLCKQGGSKTFLELVEIANLKNPFDGQTFSEIIPAIEKYLSSIDDNKL